MTGEMTIDRRNFLKISGGAIGIGALYHVAPALTSRAEAAELFHHLGRESGEKVTPFSFVQLSDAHVGFNGPPDPLGTKAFERAVEMVNALPHQPDLILFTGDLTHDSEDKDVRARRFAQFKEISSRLKTGKVVYVPGEHDAGIDAGELYRNEFGWSHYSFDHRGVHFIALDNVSQPKPEVGEEQRAWLAKDLARFSKAAPIVVFTHRPLFDLKPEWEWFTSDGDDVMNLLASFDNVTVLYGHIHRDDEHHERHASHYGARSLIFAFPDPAKTAGGDKKPLPFDKQHPFRELGIRTVDSRPKRALEIHDVELTLREFSGVNGIQQLIKNPGFGL
jgi:3',5'-cyclic AMP phosphodiesterase CpdA